MTHTDTFSGIDPTNGNGRILYVEDGVIQKERACAAQGLPVLAPGLIDLQINGYGGHDLNGDELHAADVEALSAALCKVGVATYLPTLITASEESLCQRFSQISQAKQTLPYAGQMIAGIHVEGPSISIKDGPRGAHPAQHIRPPSIDEFERWQQAADGLITMVTLAPEVNGAIDYIHQLTRRGICVALGHCDATENEILRAVDAGAQMSTHLGNGIASTMPRHPNAIWAQLAEDRLSASLILDGHHLPGSTARSMIRAKELSRVILVSDSVKFAGMPAGRYESAIGGDVEVSDDGRISIAGTPYLAGSGANLLSIVTGFTQLIGLPFLEGLRMATQNPAAILGRSVNLQPGERADFILFNLDNNTGAVSVRDIVFGGVSVMQ